MSQITTHVLDTARGKPVQGINIQFLCQQDDGWQLLASGQTNSDGRVAGLLPEDKVLDGGIYRLHFDTQPYYQARGESSFYPFVDIVFNLDAGGQHYHVPLLISAFGYSTYRGS